MSLTRMLQLGAVALAAVALAAGPASAKTGGSSANANLCKKGGWQNLFTAPPIKDFDTGVPFKNQGDCVSYAVHGGTPSTADQLAERACQTFGGTFNSDYPETIPPYILWTCVGTPDEDNVLNAIAAVCFGPSGGNALETRWVCERELAGPAVPQECQNGAYADLFPQDGAGTSSSPASTFPSEDACADWIRPGNSYGTLKPELRNRGDAVMQLWLTAQGYSGQCGISYEIFSSQYPGGPASSGCLDPPNQGFPFEISESGCDPGSTWSVDIQMTTSSGGVVRRSVTNTCV